MEYLKLDYEDVKGFKGLTKEQKELFKETYKLHNSIQGREYKEDYTPVSVEWIEGDNYLRVVFKKGIWLHYTTEKTWY